MSFNNDKDFLETSSVPNYNFSFQVWIWTDDFLKTTARLYDILQSLQSAPDIIAISETKLTQTCMLIYIFLDAFSLIISSKTQAGGVGVYLSCNLEFTIKETWSGY